MRSVRMNVAQNERKTKAVAALSVAYLQDRAIIRSNLLRACRVQNGYKQEMHPPARWFDLMGEAWSPRTITPTGTMFS